MSINARLPMFAGQVFLLSDVKIGSRERGAVFVVSVDFFDLVVTRIVLTLAFTSVLA